jgi:L-alanine-DL-glutamate epimerase-like enolase superfamily enzyme
MELSDTPVEKVDVSAYTIPADAPEGDGTLRWDSTTLIVCEVRAADQAGLGYTYGDKATAIVPDHLAEKCLLHHAALDVPGLHASMLVQVRNDGSRGIASMAISALDIALWDLKAKLLKCSVVDLLGAAHTSVVAYGSGRFTNYNDQHLVGQLSGWVADGLKSVKMKIGTEPAADLERIHAAREAIGPSTNLFVDANGAYSTRQAIAFAKKFEEFNIPWFEEPVSSDDLDGPRRCVIAFPARWRL